MHFTRSPRAGSVVARTTLVAATFAALTTPVWIDRLAEAEPSVDAVDDLILDDGERRLAPDNAREGVRLRLELLHDALHDIDVDAHARPEARRIRDDGFPLPRRFDPDAHTR